MPQFCLTPCQRKSSFPETEEKVRRLKRKNAELAVIAKRLEERARKLQETNLRVVRTGGCWAEAGRPRKRGAKAGLEGCLKLGSHRLSTQESKNLRDKVQEGQRLARQGGERFLEL